VIDYSRSRSRSFRIERIRHGNCDRELCELLLHPESRIRIAASQRAKEIEGYNERLQNEEQRRTRDSRSRSC